MSVLRSVHEIVYTRMPTDCTDAVISRSLGYTSFVRTQHQLRTRI